MSKDVLKYWRLAALVGVGAALYFAGTHPELQPYFELDYLRSLADQAGMAGMATFVGVFVAGYLMQIPGMIFVVAALLGWGPIAGGLIAFVGALLASVANFWAVRAVGGSLLSEVENDWVKKMLGKLDDHPVRTVVVLRTFFFMNPVMHLPLVLSGVPFRPYIIGSLVGLIAPIAVISLSLDTVMAWLNLG
jgi:uncharacterized membrane protein YdjX (TVP38/TMEM64 family)